MPCNTNSFVHYFLILASGGCHVSILFLEMHSCYTPLFFLHLHCAHDDLSIAYTLCFALAYAFPFVFLYLMIPIQGHMVPVYIVTSHCIC